MSDVEETCVGGFANQVWIGKKAECHEGIDRYRQIMSCAVIVNYSSVSPYPGLTAAAGADAATHNLLRAVPTLLLVASIERDNSDTEPCGISSGFHSHAPPSTTSTCPVRAHT
jgi:hypothetical protein